MATNTVDFSGLTVKADTFDGDITGSISNASIDALVALTDDTSGTANDTVADVADIALSTSDMYTDAAVNAAVNTAIATVNDDLADLTAKVNAIISAIQS